MVTRVLLLAFPCVAALAAGAYACGGANNPLSTSGDGGGGSSGSSSGSGSGGGAGSGSGGASGSSGGGSGGSSGAGSGGGSGGASGSSSGSTGDAGCPPCDPGNVNLPGVDCDLDCSGTSKPPGPCDQSVTASGDANDFAKAIGLCQVASASTWGVASAAFTQGYDSTTAPNAGQHAILPAFGAVLTPREGKNLAVLSSGWALQCDDADAGTSCSATGMGDPYFKGPQTQMSGAGTVPPGYPKGPSQCMLATMAYDVIGVTLQIKVPKNVSGFSIDSNFFSGDWPEFVCSQFNDGYAVWLQSSAWSGVGAQGDLNIVFDTMQNPVTVNSPFISRCTDATPTGCMGTVMGTAACPAGATELQGTGFYNFTTYCTNPSSGGAATGWLTTTAPVKGGETITVQFLVWDTGDYNWDSSVLFDHFVWYGAAQTAATMPAK